LRIDLQAVQMQLAETKQENEELQSRSLTIEERLAVLEQDKERQQTKVVALELQLAEKIQGSSRESPSLTRGFRDVTEWIKNALVWRMLISFVMVFMAKLSWHRQEAWKLIFKLIECSRDIKKSLKQVDIKKWALDWRAVLILLMLFIATVAMLFISRLKLTQMRQEYSTLNDELQKSRDEVAHMKEACFLREKCRRWWGTEYVCK